MNISAPPRFTTEDFRARALSRLSPDLDPDALDPSRTFLRGDHILNAALEPGALEAAPARAAAVLAPIVARPGGPTVLLTQRASHMRDHSGQVAFPGGKIDEGETPLEAALREAHEEIGLDARYIEPLGWLNPYLTGTGFRIMPLVALVDPAFELTINPREVDDAFETPLSFLMDEANHKRHQREWRGRALHFYAMPYEQRFIWGATAGIIRELYERLYR